MVDGLIRCIVLICAAAISSAAIADEFHPPVTKAERTVASVLKAEKDFMHSAPLYYYLTGYKASAQDSYYDTLFTKTFRKSIIEANQAMLKKNCGGKYIQGEMCGLDIDPISCSNDVSDIYFFRTESQTATEAMISSAWPDAHIPTATYKLRKTASHWKIDAVSCPGYMQFNWDNDR